jgi:hypothetical protein
MNKKNGEAQESVVWILPSRRNFPEFQIGLRLMWLVISSAHNLITVIQTVRRKLHTTLNNICTVLTSTRIEPELSESLNIQFVMSTFPLYQRGSQGMNLNTKFAPNSGLKFRANSIRGVTDVVNLCIL